MAANRAFPQHIPVLLTIGRKLKLSIKNTFFIFVSVKAGGMRIARPRTQSGGEKPEPMTKEEQEEFPSERYIDRCSSKEHIETLDLRVIIKQV